MNIKSWVSGALYRNGLEVHTTRSIATSSGVLKRFIGFHGIDLVLDVGANVGQFGAQLRSGGYKGRIVSFEPLSSAHAALVKTAARDRGWTVAPRFALGAEEGELEIFLAGESSSVLSSTDLFHRTAPHAVAHGSERVQIRPLDRVAPPYMEGSKATFLKIDVQGFEDRVLKGAQRTLERVRGLQVEVSMLPLYEGQVLWRQLIASIEALGFELHTMLPVFSDPASGRLLQFDAVFFRN